MAALHPSCASVRIEHDGAEAEIQNAADLIRWQWQLQRLALIATGVPGSYNGSFTDGWKPYSAGGSLNFADASSWDVVSVSGRNVTLDLQGGGDPRTLALYQFRVTDPILGLSAGFGLRTGCLQPGDVIQFSENSVISNSCWPVIVRIVSYDVPNSRVVVECDKEPTAALTKFPIDDGNGGWMPDPNPVTCRVWQHAGNEAKWRKIIRPDYFYGQRKRLAIDAAAVPPDGIVELEADAAVMHPGGFDPLRPTWVLEGQRLDDNQWEAVPGANDRLFVLPAGPSRVALKDQVPAESHVDGLADLTETYGRFRMVYYKRAEATANGCELVGYGRCRWSVPDYTDSAPGGEAGCQPGWTCLKRAIDINTVSDEWDRTVVPAVPGQDGIMDTTTHSDGQASGAARYPEGGQCLQHGMCDQFAPAEGHGDGTPYSAPHHAGNVLRELWGACDMRLQRIRLMDTSFAAWQAQRVAHPSIAWHLGYVNLTTAYGLHEISSWRGNGAWGLDYYTWTDGDGDEHLELQPGAFEGWRHDDPAVDYEGDLPAEVTGFKTARNPIDPDVPATMLEMERIGVLVEKDTGELQPRGISQSSVAVAAQDIVVPNIDLSETGAQTRGVASFEWDGVGDAVITLMPLRPESKAPSMLGSRTIHSVSDQGDGVVRVTFENVQHTYSVIDDGPMIGDSFDRLINWWGGGGWPIMPKPKQQIDCFYEWDKYTGGRNGGAWPGDAVAHGDRCFVINAVEPYGGAAADNWGSTRVENLLLRGGGMFVPAPANVGDGSVAYTSIKDSLSNDLVRLEDAERPPIGAGECWIDGGEVYFSAADDGKAIELKYDVYDAEGKLTGAHTEIFIIRARVTVTLNFPTAIWTDADTVQLLLYGTPMTAAGSAAAVGAGQYYADTSGSNVELTTHIMQAGNEIDVVLTWMTPQPAPGDHYCLGGNLQSFGRNRDYIDAYDDADGYLLGLPQGTTLVFNSCQAVMLPGAGLEWTPYGTDDWQAVSGAQVRHGTGEFVIPASWFSGKPSVLCFRLTNVRWMDHRGIVPGSVWEKTRTVMEALTTRGWVQTSWGGGRGQVLINRYRNHLWYYSRDVDLVEGTCGPWHVAMDEWSAGNIVPPFPPYDYYRLDSNPYPSGGNDASATLLTRAATFDAPEALRMLPDGTEILQAVTEVTVGNLVKTYSNAGLPIMSDCSGQFFDGIDPYVEEIPSGSVAYAIIGITGPGPLDYVEVGRVSGAADGTKVIDVTDIVNTMLDAASAGTYPYGYGLILLPDTGPDAMDPPDGPGIIYTTDTTCNPGPCDTGRANLQPPETWEIRWTGASVGRLAVKVKLPDEDRERLLIMDRWPARGDLE